MRLSVSLACIALVAFVESASAQTVLDIAPVSQPVVTITATATSSVANDRMHAFLRAEAEDTDATKAASQVNARMARALSRARGVAGVEAATAGYSSYQIMEQNKPVRWRVARMACELLRFLHSHCYEWRRKWRESLRRGWRIRPTWEAS